MKLNPLGSNMTELEFGDYSILFSYKTPVAGYGPSGPFRTDEHYSRTTTKHINKYLGGKDVGEVVSQDYIDTLAQVK